MKRALAIAAAVPLGVGLSLTVAGGVASAAPALGGPANCVGKLASYGAPFGPTFIVEGAQLKDVTGLPVPQASGVASAASANCTNPIL